MNKHLTLATLGILALVSVPPSVADHGLVLEYASIPADGCVLSYTGSYVSGAGPSQVWDFVIVAVGTCGPAAESCQGFGWIEGGFTALGCTNAWTTGPTGDFHPFPNPADVHQPVAMTFGSVATTGVLAALG